MQVLVKRLKDKNFINYVLILLLVLLMAASYLGYSDNQEIQENKYYAEVEVGEIVGFDVNNSALIFGSILPKGSASRRITLENTYDFDIVVKFLAEGDISDFFFKENILIRKGAVEKIGLNVLAPKGTEKGIYSGNISIVIYKY